MPRYVYRCTACEELSTISHASSETITECPKCSNPTGLVKMLTRFTTPRTSVVKKRTGETTEEFIQDARKELIKQKDQLNKTR